MNIFFIASIHGSEKYGDCYLSIISYFSELGHRVVADHVVKVTSKDIAEWNEDKDVDFHKRILDGIKKADLIVVEMSYSSTSVGYLVSVAVESGKPAIAFYSGIEIPHLLATLEKHDKFQLVHYKDVRNLKKEIPLLISYATEQMDTRFNFFISPRIGNYLDWIAKKKKTPRAVYLRKLIEKEMESNSEYKKA